jgi:hypothetical protein
VYEALGPTTTATAPFSLVYAWDGNSPAFASIPSGATSPDFSFRPYLMEIRYRSTPGQAFFNQVVDDVRWDAVPVDFTINYFLPEPGGISLAALALGAGMAIRRRALGAPRRR